MRRPPAGPGAASGLRGREMAERAASAVWRSVTRVRRGRERDAHRPRSPGQPLGREDPAARRNWCSDIAMGVEATERAFFSSYSCVLNHARLEKFAEGQLDARHRVGRRRTRTATRPQMAERTTRRGCSSRNTPTTTRFTHQESWSTLGPHVALGGDGGDAWHGPISSPAPAPKKPSGADRLSTT